MGDVERRRRPRIAWIDRSLRSKALVVLLAPTLVLAVAALFTAWFASSAALRALDAGALVLALGLGLGLWHSFTTGVVSRLRRLEHETDRIEGAGPTGEARGRDEIGRLAARLEEAAAQVRAHVGERDAAQRAAEERRSMVESIFHASPDTIVVRDATGCVVMASPSPAELTDAADRRRAAGRLVDSSFRDGRMRREDHIALERLIALALAGEQDLAPVVTTSRLRRGRGGIRTFETRARPILDDRDTATGTVTVSRDITERVELERSLRRATVAAERASEAKSQFLSRMSHELRTPLNAVLGFAQLLELDQLSPDQAASVDQIERAARHLLSLINEVLDIARIEAGQLTVTTESVHVGEILDEVAALLVPMAETAAVHMMIEPPARPVCHVRADRQRLLQVLLNLGSNAVKYNEPGGTVAFRTTANPDGTVRVSVHDTGPGIPVEQQDLLFVPFTRLGAERSGVEGTGVGLAVSKQLVEVMGGTIGVESAPGHGSTFFVDLLAAGQAEVTRHPGGAAPGLEAAPVLEVAPVLGVAPVLEVAPVLGVAPGLAAGGGPNDGEDRAPGAWEGRQDLVVLHVEDDRSNASLVAQVLGRRPKVRLRSAADAGQGLALARSEHPDLLLLDLHLPDLPGDELLNQIKADPDLADIKVVVVSADATPARIRRLLDLGAEGYLTKPLDVDALLKLVDDDAGRRSPAGR